MSYNFGQLRSSQIDRNNYLTDLDYEIKDFKTESPVSAGVEFTDKKIEVNLKYDINKIRSYYIRFTVEKQSKEQRITLSLKNNKSKDNTQVINTFSIEPGEGKVTLEYVITPNATYNRIELVLNRTNEDYISEIDRQIILEVNKITEVNNIIDKIDGVNKLKQIGVQGNMGLSMNIEGEHIRIGKNGIYEINNGITVSFLGFIIEPEDTNQYFILDYQY